jgi:transcriptional regulator with XRE-family HTH domain
MKRLRERLGLTLREVEAHSQRLAAQKQNHDFFISRGWLNNIENGVYTPSIFKLYALGAIYHVHWSSIFSLFGCNLGDFGRDQALFAPRKTQLASHAVDARDTLVVPMKSRDELDRTNLLSRLAEIWGEIPIRLIQHLDLRNGVYGFVGMSDRTMYPIIRPGSIVQIDQNQQKILPLHWQNEHERPIYFIELRGQYICSWCEMREGYLSAVPHPNSKCEVRRFSYPREAEIVGRVIGVTMRLVEAE